MKKILILLVAGLLLAVSCGVGSYSVSSGKADECSISFTMADKTPITVNIDGAKYDVEAVKTSAFKVNRDIKFTSANTIYLKPGAHDVKVILGGKQIYSKKLYISVQEHKIVEL